MKRTRHLEALLKAESRHQRELRTTDQRAIDTARRAQDLRLDALNELRQSVEKDRNQLINRAEYTVQQQALAEKIDALGAFMAAQQGQQTGKLDSRTVILAVLAILATVGGGIALYVH